ncbi:hypothetical protein [uncultured Paludibaculum sp.]|uniref:hypothetical protein n=1 Tax=uncultured Paludibaculum sp. TaxID=1765020 RepID=UPI002AABC7D8|nr:hypothetical protein [uncultured Paludibaculum sp.]
MAPRLDLVRETSANQLKDMTIMEWTRSETLALALSSCTQCFGMGVRSHRSGHLRPCSCVLRSIFRACYARFRRSLEKEKHLSVTTLDGTHRGGRRNTWGRKNEEFIADFYLVTRRTLTGMEWRIFSAHYLLGADWRLCSRQLKLDRGTFFHSIYAIEKKLGLAYRNLAPYALFPTDDYFQGVTAHAEPPKPMQVIEMRRVSLHDCLNVPVRRAA